MALLASIIEWVGYGLVGIILIRVIMSWTGNNLGNSPAARVIYEITEPILAPLRRFARIGMIDLSPMVASFTILICSQLIRNAIT